ncbi:TIGR03905 family TSCPD domain-containing protein [Anaerovibrio lipolyticus]|uniref:TIGR03905 family TSCPD domain-containing protein n=2 Tax=Anaerovibrio TaxID=82373 RepID=UPI001B20352C|nr:TIGR03905 family TSCPD domain-containing protein [Anaerovibrio lipolyticus]MBO5589108.1 TIGR03905 family TSCPD domain-containing protein [Anaerovibrio sp.]
MSAFEYAPQGVCSRLMQFDIEDNKIHNLKVVGGCNGNLQGIGKLVEGMDIDEVISRVEGIRCGARPTSCPDQLSKALKQAKEQL